MIKCVEHNGKAYVQLFCPDRNMQVAILEECRGLLCRSAFEKIAGLPSGYFSKVKNGLKKAMSSKYINLILNAADKNSSVTEEDFIISNGMVPYEKIQKVLSFLKPAENDKRDLRKAEYAEPQFIKKHVFRPDDYDAFLENLLFFSLYVPEQKMEKILDVKEEIFKDKGFSRMLDRFHELKKSEISSTYDYLCQEDRDEELHYDGCAITEAYKTLILEQLEYF